MSGQPIIIKKVKKHGHGAHSGAWKVAYADFVTAMMAFFLLLWLLNAVTHEQLQGISDYFAPISKETSVSGGVGLLQGEVVAVKGAFDRSKLEVAIPPPQTPRLPSDTTDDGTPTSDGDSDTEQAAAAASAKPASDTRSPGTQEALANENALFAEAQSAVKQAFDEHPELKPLANSLIMETTPEGLRIQIVDQDGLPMFPRGQAVMYQYTKRVLQIVANAIGRMPELIEISGHTDATPFANGGAYGNWELSADRANAARRVLVESGLNDVRVERVVGRAATEPLLPQNPEAAGNRRLTIVLLRGTAAP